MRGWLDRGLARGARLGARCVWYDSIRSALMLQSVPLDWTCGDLSEGLRCFHSGAFFQAHEHWELVWLAAQEPEKTFLQGLIQVAASFHHFQRGNCVGTISLLLLGPEPPGCVSRGLWWHCGGAASRGHPFMARSSRNRPAIFPTARSTA